MKGFWKMIDELRAIDNMKDEIEIFARHLYNHVAFAPIELKDTETVKAIIEKACKVEYDTDLIIYTFDCEYNRGRKYFLYLEKR